MAKAQYIMQRDTAGWRNQVWLSFAAAICSCAAGVLQLPSQQLDRAFLAIGLFFCLFSSFTLAKTVRDNRDGQVDELWIDSASPGGGWDYLVIGNQTWSDQDHWSDSGFQLEGPYGTYWAGSGFTSTSISG